MFKPLHSVPLDIAREELTSMIGIVGPANFGPPYPFASPDFAGPPLGGDNPGHHRFARHNFTVGGCYFELFVEDEPHMGPQ